VQTPLVVSQGPEPCELHAHAEVAARANERQSKQAARRGLTRAGCVHVGTEEVGLARVTVAALSLAHAAIWGKHISQWSRSPMAECLARSLKVRQLSVQHFPPTCSERPPVQVMHAVALRHVAHEASQAEEQHGHTFSRGKVECDSASNRTIAGAAAGAKEAVRATLARKLQQRRHHERMRARSQGAKKASKPRLTMLVLPRGELELRGQLSQVRPSRETYLPAGHCEQEPDVGSPA
jgi:hypothetical protein